MANPNPNIWGAPDTWINAKTWVGANNDGNSNIKACRAKTANFGGDDNEWAGALGRGIAQGKISLEPIDNSFVLCGQNPDKSAYGAIKIFTNKQDDTLNKIPDKTITYNKPINFMFHSLNANDNGYIGSLYTGIWGGVVNIENPKMRIAPDAEEGSGGAHDYNFNLQSSPYIYYQIRSLWAIIWVHEDNNTYEGGSWWTLEDWKNNHNSSSICEISVDLYGYSYDDGTTIHLSRAPNNLGDFRSITATTLEPIDGVTMYANTAYNQAPIIMLLNKLIYNYHETAYEFIGYGWRDDFDGGTIKSYTDPSSTSHGWSLQLSIPYTADNYERIMAEMACFGIPFSDSNHDSYPINFNANYVCLPVINDEGIATGEYTRGADNLTNPFAELDSVRDKNYDPNADYDPNTYSNITGFNSITSGATMTKRYVLDAANVDKLGDDLWTICGQLSSQDFEYFDGKLKDEFLTTNPIDSIISLQRFPFEIPHVGTTKAPIKLGKATATAEGYTTYSPFNSIVFAGKSIFPRFGNCFLDYEPYTSYELYVPFCGTTKIRAADILGHTLNITMQIDLFTGSCTAYIMADKLVIETMNGSCGVDQTISGAQTATMNANIFNGILNQKAAERQETTTIAKMLYPTGWISAILNPVGGYEKIENAKTQSQIANYEITHLDVPPHKIGAASPLLAWCQEFDARIIIYYPEGDVIQSGTPPSFNKSALQAFGHTKGYGIVTPGTVSSFHGYTQGTIIADQIPCTESERNRIKEAFASGVFLP